MTFNLRDFPPEALARYEVTPIHPDEFIVAIARSDEATVRAVLADHRHGLQRPALTPEMYVAAFIRAGLTRSAAVASGVESG